MPITTPNYSNISLDEMAAVIGLKPKHMPILIMSFLEESATILETMGGAITSNDYETIRTTAHSIKGSAGNLHFTEVYEMAKELENAAGSSNREFDYSGYYQAISSAIATIKL